MSNFFPSDRSGVARNEELVYAVLSRAAATLGARAERSDLEVDSLLAKDPEDVDLVDFFEAAAPQLGLALRETDQSKLVDIFDLVKDGFPVILIEASGECHLLRRLVGRKLEVATFRDSDVQTTLMSRRAAKRLMGAGDLRTLVVKQELECDSVSASPIHHTGDLGSMSPVRRFFALLRLDSRDIGMVAIFSLVAGILSLAIPLAVESLVNVVSWGIYLQPLIILAIMLLTCLGFSALLRILETIVVEIIQRRQLVRFVSDLAHRFPRANQAYLQGQYPRELANRVFDIMTIQKATAILLLDGVAIVLTALMGMLLLAFYHPFLLGFDLVLLFSMVLITLLLGRGGIRTAIKESKTKYRIAHWLQDVLDSPESFRVNGGEGLAIDRANRLATDYVQARKQQFRVVLRQVVFAVGLQVVASTALLGLGGWLVIQGQLTLGQLVASELIVTVVVGAFSKAGKSLEKYYDMMAGIDKVGQLLDIPTDRHDEVPFTTGAALEVKWEDVRLQFGTTSVALPPGQLETGQITAIRSGQDLSPIARAFGGLLAAQSGIIEVDGMDVTRLAVGCHEGQAVGFACKPQVFHGSIVDNVSMGRSCVGRGRVREVLQELSAWDEITKLKDGLDTALQTNGYPLSENLLIKLMIARATAGTPGLLVIDGLLDLLPPDQRAQLLDFLRSDNHNWTVAITTRLKSVAESCDHHFELE